MRACVCADTVPLASSPAAVSGSPTSGFAEQYGKGRVHSAEHRARHGGVLRPRSDGQMQSPLSAAATRAHEAGMQRKLSARTASAFLPDQLIARGLVFRLLAWLTHWIFVPLNSFDVVGLTAIPTDQGLLYFGRHSTHNSDILANVVRVWSVSNGGEREGEAG